MNGWMDARPAGRRSSDVIYPPLPEYSRLTPAFRRGIACAALLLLAASILSSKPAGRVPDWYMDRDAAYPSARYITAEGSGASEGEAREAALSQISLYFNTTAEVSNSLIRTYNELDGKKYSFSSETSTVERATIRSSAEFFGVRFTEPYAAKEGVYILAYINRADAFAVYERDIRQNEALLRQLVAAAEDGMNPVTALDAARQAVRVADVTAALIRNALIVRSADGGAFAGAEALVQRSHAALAACRGNMAFSLDVDHDYNGTVRTALASLLEEHGYAVAAGDEGRSLLRVQVSITEDQKPAGYFVYATVGVTGAGADGTPYFSWSRDVGRKGAKAPNDARRRAYLAIAEELRRSFITEFDARIQLHAEE